MSSQISEERESRPHIRAAAASIAAVYKTCALIFFNTVVIYVLLNLALGTAIRVRDALYANDPVTDRYGDDVLDKVYPGMDRQERQLMLSEHFQPYIFSDFNHFRERPIAGKYVHVTEAGYRQSVDQGPWPPAPENVNIFAFGGSTTFGCGLPDNETVPTFLQATLAKHAKSRVCMYNFGVGYYYSTQERICLEKLLMDGFTPDIVVFIDGINEGTHLDNRPTNSREMSLIYEQFLGSGPFPMPNAPYWQSAGDVLLYRLPVGRAARRLTAQMRPTTIIDAKGDQNWEGQSSAIRVCETYFTNKFLIEQSCLRFGVTPLFVWQPSPAYNYDLKYHLFAPPPTHFHFAIMPEYYSTMRDLLLQRMDNNLVWCGDMQKDRTESLYCDGYHYTAAFSKELAEYVCQVCLERGLINRSLEKK